MGKYSWTLGGVLIAGAIAVLVVPNVMSGLGCSEGKWCVADSQARFLSMVAAEFYESHGRYPSDLQELVSQCPNREGRMESRCVSDADVVDPWGNRVHIVSTIEGNGAAILSFGADGKPGGTGTAADIKVSL